MKQLFLVILLIIIISIGYAQNKDTKAQPEFTPHLKGIAKHLKSNMPTRFRNAPHKGKDECLTCHIGRNPNNKTPSDRAKKPAIDFEKSVHQKAGLFCSDCHGGNSSKQDFSAMGEMFGGKPNGFIGKPQKKDIPLLCARCHSNPSYIKKHNPKLPVNQLDRYLTSMHGQQLSRGRNDVAVCSDCHNAHNILSKKEPTSSVYDVNVPATCAQCHNNPKKMKNSTNKLTKAATQYKEYVTSFHGKRLLEDHKIDAPACNDCHGNHGAMPPGINSVSISCKQCHPRNAELYLSSPHKKAFEKQTLPKCATCHTRHSFHRPKHAFIEQKIVKKDSDCLICHAKEKSSLLKKLPMAAFKQETELCFKCHDQTKNPKAYKTIVKMKKTLTNFAIQLKQVTDDLNDAENKGIEVSETRFKLNKIKEIQTTLRTLHHRGSLTAKIKPENKSYQEKADAGIKLLETEIQKETSAALNEYFSRRNWAAISILVITFLVIMLILKIRKIEQK